MSKIDIQKLDDRIHREPVSFLKTMGFDGQVRGDEFTVGSIIGERGNSFSIQLSTSLFHDFNSKNKRSGKGWVYLISQKTDVDIQTAANAIIQMMSWKCSDFIFKDESKPKTSQDKCVIPVPESARNHGFKLGDALKADSAYRLSAIYDYKNVDGELNHLVLRYENVVAGADVKSDKQIRPAYYWGADKRWVMRKPKDRGSSSLYGLEKLSQFPNKPVLLVEGEKTADAAQKIFPEYNTMTWQGGSSRINRACWEDLVGKDVVYWPDADEAGKGTIPEIQQNLGLAKCNSLKLVDVIDKLPAKWDLADEAPEGVSVQVLLDRAEALSLSAVKELHNLSFTQLSSRWVYIVATEEFYDQLTGTSVLKSQFDALYRHLPEAKKQSISNKFLTEFPNQKLIKRLYSPGVSNRIIVTKDGLKCLNTWTGSEVEPVDGNAEIFSNHIRFLCGSDEEYEHLADMLAYMVQHQGEKLKSAPIVLGPQGTGKSYLGDMMRKILGSSNVTMVVSSELRGDFNEYLDEKLLIVVEELMAVGRRDTANNLKPLITQPTVSINKKYASRREVKNTANFIFFTNYTDAIPLEERERRYHVVQGRQPKRKQSYYNELWTWSESNLGIILNWLSKRDLSKFSPNKEPPLTEAKRDMIEASRPIIETEIKQMVADFTGPFEFDLVEIKCVVMALRDLNIREASNSNVARAIAQLGGVKLSQRKANIDGREHKVSLWAIRHMEYWMSVSKADTVKAYINRNAKYPNDNVTNLF